jgi:hypothetical protein
VWFTQAEEVLMELINKSNNAFKNYIKDQQKKPIYPEEKYITSYKKRNKKQKETGNILLQNNASAIT